MSTHFKPTQFDIKDEKGNQTEVRVVKLETGGAPQIKAFAFNQLQQAGKGDYQTVKAKYGPLAATDQDRHSKTSRDSRFSINPLLRDPLAVETEERRVIDERVRVRIEDIKEQSSAEGAERGYQAGLKKGYEEAFALFKTEGADRLASFENLLKSFESLKHDMFKANERFLLETVFRISKMVMLKELQADEKYLLRLCSELVERVGTRDNITIKLSAQDQKSVEMLREELPKMMGEMKNLRFQTSEQVLDGGCSIETQWSAIDASVDTQLRGIYEALIGQPMAAIPAGETPA
jgi:flagellar biosynthesis/type III secretory pathway protein FliH